MTTKCIVPTEFDIRALPEFKEKLENFSGDEVLEFDFTNVESMDAAACQFLLSLKKTYINQSDKCIFKGLSSGVAGDILARLCIPYD